jgi:hypothetical protein
VVAARRLRSNLPVPLGDRLSCRSCIVRAGQLPRKEKRSFHRHPVLSRDAPGEQDFCRRDSHGAVRPEKRCTLLTKKGKAAARDIK